jgi:hypothetical protein
LKIIDALREANYRGVGIAERPIRRSLILNFYVNFGGIERDDGDSNERGLGLAGNPKSTQKKSGE